MATLRTDVEVFDQNGAPLGSVFAIISRTRGDGWTGMLQKRPDDSIQDIPLEGSEIVLEFPGGRRSRAVIRNRPLEPSMTTNIDGIGPAPFDPSVI